MVPAARQICRVTLRKFLGAIIAIAGVLVMIVCITTYLQPDQSEGPQQSLTTRPVIDQTAPQQLDALQPVAISAPSVGMASDLYPGGYATGPDYVVDPLDDRPVWLSETSIPDGNSSGAALIAGHNYVRSDGSSPAFSSLERLVEGDEVFVDTPNQRLTYIVQTTERVEKALYSQRVDLRENVPGRLILGTCDVRNGRSTNDNFVVVAQLSE